MSGNIPDYTLVIRIPDPDDPNNAIGWQQVGVAWRNRNGNLSLKLNIGVTLDWRLTQEFSVMLCERTETTTTPDTKQS